MSVQQKTLLAGPWVGEFGFECMMWQAHLRHLSLSYERTIVAIRPGHELMYKDFASDFFYYNKDGARSGPCSNGQIFHLAPEEIDKYQKKYNNVHYYAPTHQMGHQLDWRDPNHPQQFIKFGRPNPRYQFDVVFHVRQRTAWGGDRNWPIENWRHLGQSCKNGYRVACIGQNDGESLLLPGVADLRGVSLSTLAEIFASSRLVVGGVSGPIHFASLCQTPQLTWIRPGEESLLLSKWNPLQTTTIILSRWAYNPPVERILYAIRQYLNYGIVQHIFPLPSASAQSPRQAVPSTLPKTIRSHSEVRRPMGLARALHPATIRQLGHKKCSPHPKESIRRLGPR